MPVLAVSAILAAGITNRKYLGHDDLVTMEPSEEIPRVFDCWSYWLSAAGICDSLDDVDMLEMHVFGTFRLQLNLRGECTMVICGVQATHSFAFAGLCRVPAEVPESTR